MSNFEKIPTGQIPQGRELISEDFATFFRDVHGYDPFPWQKRLVAQVLEFGEWPEVIDLPTGSGKTAVLDIAVFVMAAQPKTSPRRIVFVIDRRIVVDQVYERALTIQDKVEAGETLILKQIRNRLQALSDGKSLSVAALRGGIPLDTDWAIHPDQPWVLVSTVDQFGSRLLFRGYGVRQGMRPIHAGLTGNDCLVILDEVHLSVPFAETLAQISQIASLPNSGILPRRYSIVEMSATPSRVFTKKFTLDPLTDLNQCAVLRRRVNVVKHAKLETVTNQAAMPKTVLKIVNFIRRHQPQIRCIGVVVNRVRTAREIFTALDCGDQDVHLITGRMRPLDRKHVLDRIGPIVDPDNNQCSNDLTVVVATQSIEVGADFSFDALVSECASIDSLSQRFGRLDRRGIYQNTNGSPAMAWIIGIKSVLASKKPDPVYGDAIRATWEQLRQRSESEDSLDVGPCALRDFPKDCNAPRATAPLVLKTHMDAWVQTHPEPLVGPSIEWYLHGIDQNRSADVSVLWRWDRSLEALQLVPPRQAEFIQVPTAAVKAWLANCEEVDFGDAGSPNPSPSQDELNTHEQGTERWGRWDGFKKGVVQLKSVEEIRPGDVIVVDPTIGGLTTGNWDPSSREVVDDFGDYAQSAYGRKVTLRLDSRLSYVVAPPSPAEELESEVTASERIAVWFKTWVVNVNQEPSWITKAIQTLDNSFDLTTVRSNVEDKNNGYYILTERHRKTGKQIVDEGIMGDSDEVGSFTSTGTKLSEHLEGVGIRAAQIAERLYLPSEISEDLRLAGRLHDLGKVDSRFQMKMVGNNKVDMEMYRNEPLAKSLPGVPRSGGSYPKGMRHELASVAMIESNDSVIESRCYDRDLVLHLVGTHHGRGRPLPPIISDPDPQVLSYTIDGRSLTANSNLSESSLALDMADRFWRLVERYGYHGLVWLETIIRLADHQQSADEARKS